MERTLLAWMRTEIAILAFAFLLKKFGVDVAENLQINQQLEYALYFLCGLVIVMSVLSLMRCQSSMAKLGPAEIPNGASKYVVLFTGIVGVILCVISSLVVFVV